MVSGTALPIRGYVFDRLPALGTGRLRPGVIVGVTAATAALLFVLSQKWVDAITTSLIFGIVLLSIVMVTGFCGQISLGQWALAGMGAFIAARLVAASGVPFELAALIGIVGTVPLGLAFALPAVRTAGSTSRSSPSGLGLAVQAIVFDNSEWNGGIGGTVMGRQTVFGISIDRIDHPEAYGILTLVCFLVVAIMVANVRRGRVGRRLIAVRTNERAAAALGINIVGAKLYAFGLASAFAALGGILYAFRSRSVDFSTWSFGVDSIVLVGLAVIGGIGFTIGPLFGSILAAGAIGAAVSSELFSGLEDYIVLIGGISLIAILLADPDGLASQNTRLGHRMLARFRRAAPPAPVMTLPEPGERHVVVPLVLRVDDVQVRYGGVVAVDGLSLEVHPGEIVGLIGPNGAGKTSAIDAITGFARIHAGDVVLGDSSIRRLPALPAGARRVCRDRSSRSSCSKT